MNELLKIENHIFTIRGEQVMVDRDLAEMYGVETRAINQAVKRNSARFPEAFMFQLTEKEFENWKSQIVISNNAKMGLRKIPYVFTEQGVAMLSAVLRSEIAVKVSVQIMQAFVQMRRTINNNLSLLQLSQDFEQFKLKTDGNFEKIFNSLNHSETLPTQGIFYDGQTYDAYAFVNQLIKKAKTSIVLIDNYIDDTVITLLTAKKKDVKVTLLTKTISKKLELDIAKANTQYPEFILKSFALSHDRFMILDGETVYHIGASLKDLGKKWFAFTQMQGESLKILETLNEIVQ